MSDGDEILSERPSDWSRLRLLLGDGRQVAALVLSSVVAGLAESAIVALVAQVATALVGRSSKVTADLGPIHLTATLGVLLATAAVVALVRLALQVVISAVPARIATDVQDRLRRNLFAAFTHASWDVQSRDREGVLQELVSGQATQAVGGALQATTLLVMSLTFLILVISAFILNPLAALIVLFTAIALFATLRPLSERSRLRAGETSVALIDLASGANETVRLAEESQVFGTNAAQRDRFGRMISDVRAPFYSMQFLARLVPGVYQSLVYILIVAALAAVYSSGAGHVASLGAVVLLLVRAGTYGQGIQSSYQSMRQSLPFLDQVEAAERRYAASRPPRGDRPLHAVESIAYDCVSFSYVPQRPVLAGITFNVSRGETVGIVGPSGAGKSTFVQILLGLRVADSGRYLVNDVPAEQFRQADWQQSFAYLPQEPHLLHATVAENIRFFRDLDKTAVERAARLAGIHDDIIKWPGGYETTVGPRADAVSGGQQQRICLARALAARPYVLVLDEPTSALDPQSESLIQQSLATLAGSLTVFVVAHRMSTLDICERVMVIVDGRLEAFDTAAQLRNENAYYRSASAIGAGLFAP